MKNAKKANEDQRSISLRPHALAFVYAHDRLYNLFGKLRRNTRPPGFSWGRRVEHSSRSGEF